MTTTTTISNYILEIFIDRDHADYDLLRSMYDKKISDKNSTDSGFDLVFPHDVLIKAGDTCIIDIGIKCFLFAGETILPFYIYPRSSISKYPVRLANSVGIIDSGYRGNIFVALDNRGSNDYMIKSGMSLVQICAPDLRSFTTVFSKFKNIDDKFFKTNRGSGGFGSTDI